MDIKHLPVINWKLAIKIAGNKRDIAEEILTLLIKNLPTDLSAINQSYLDRDYRELTAELHKLHGALCYCGLPRLKKVVASLEDDLKNNKIDGLKTMIELLNNEATSLLKHYK